MKKISFLIALLPVLGFAQSEKKACETLARINTIIQKEHYKPKPVDDSLSVYVFNKFFELIDEDNSLFVQPEIDVLKKYQYQIDDAVLGSNCDFLSEFYTAYNKSVDRYSAIISEIKGEPFAYSSTDIIRFSKKSFPFVKDEIDLKKLYKKRILFDVLKDISEVSKNKDSILAHFDSIASKSKDKIFESFECKTSSYRLSRKDFNSLFFSAFCSYFDPHTEYFSESDRSSFLSSVSSDNLTFGMYLSMNEKDEITVDDIIPGSSAYFTEKVDAGDLVVKIKSKNEEYEVACSSMDKISEIISFQRL